MKITLTPLFLKSNWTIEEVSVEYNSSSYNYQACLSEIFCPTKVHNLGHVLKRAIISKMF